MEYYSVIYHNGKTEYISSIVKAESHFDAKRKAEEDVKDWDGFSVWNVRWLDKKRIEAGEVVFCMMA